MIGFGLVRSYITLGLMPCCCKVRGTVCQMLDSCLHESCSVDIGLVTALSSKTDTITRIVKDAVFSREYSRETSAEVGLSSELRLCVCIQDCTARCQDLLPSKMSRTLMGDSLVALSTLSDTDIVESSMQDVCYSRCVYLEVNTDGH